MSLMDGWLGGGKRKRCCVLVVLSAKDSDGSLGL